MIPGHASAAPYVERTTYGSAESRQGKEVTVVSEFLDGDCLVTSQEWEDRARRD